MLQVLQANELAAQTNQNNLTVEKDRKQTIDKYSLGEEEQELLTKMVQKQNFFTERGAKEIKDNDYKELTNCLMIEKAKPGQIMHVETLTTDPKDKEKDIGTFYFILKGEVSIIGKNTEIKDWNGKNKKLKQLQEWKKTVFDVKA